MKIGVAMSGGVDSSAVLGLLKEQGHEVLGLTLKILPCEITPEENGAVKVKTVEPKGQRCCSTRRCRPGKLRRCTTARRW